MNRFAEPSGWLSKPDFKRKEQMLSNYKDGQSMLVDISQAFAVAPRAFLIS